MIEYGYAPSYFLTQEETVELRNNGVTGLYSTVLSDWEERLVETYHEFNEAFRDVWNVKMSSHEQISDTLSVVTYENGVKVYVNYATEKQTIDGVTIEPENYLVVR